MIQIFYKNTTETPKPLYIPRCGADSCSLQSMYKLFNDVLPGDFNNECNRSILDTELEEFEMRSAIGKN